MRRRVARAEESLRPPGPRPRWWGRDPSTLTDEELDTALAHYAPGEAERISGLTDEELLADMLDRGML
jgi:hypothetical protein